MTANPLVGSAAGGRRPCRLLRYNRPEVSIRPAGPIVRPRRTARDPVEVGDVRRDHRLHTVLRRVLARFRTPTSSQSVVDLGSHARVAERG